MRDSQIRFLAQIGGGFCCLFWIIMIPVLIATSLARVQSTEVALVYDDVWKNFPSKEPLEEGLHTIPTFGSALKWPRTYVNVDFSGESTLECNSRDGIAVLCVINFQYAISLDKVYELTQIYKDKGNYKQIVEWTARSAMRHACAEFTAREFQTDRHLVPVVMETFVQQKFDNLYATVIEVQLVQIDRPVDYETVVQGKETALSDINKAHNERNQALTNAQTVLREALQMANTTIDNANRNAEAALAFADAQADSITVEFDTLARVYGGIMVEQNLTQAGILTYFSNRMLAQSSGPLNLNMPSPAKLSYEDEL